MKSITFGNKTYQVDVQNFLIDAASWDENFAIGMASLLSINNGLTEEHWKIIRYIRNAFEKEGICPLVYETCRDNQLSFLKLKELFPSGYQRGVCLLAGITYKTNIFSSYCYKDPYASPPPENVKPKIELNSREDKVYQVDVNGFLIDFSQWDETFAIHKAYEMGLARGLSEKHWKIIKYLRSYYEKNKQIPTIYECCGDNQIDLDELERLFPRGYHRCAIKIAGMRLV
ncbi:MAG: TusE/DsrC/DsvC family sulfur relay protein [Desulfobacterales bacterium]|nr:TusE/DsrC/DsvC family sulfur relay protein [Desulfobacterales bacterium]